MERLISRIATFSPETDRRELEGWADEAQAQIDRMSAGQGSLYYLVLSQFYAIYLRDIETANQMLKRVDIHLPVALDEVKVRRCFFRYLEGAYEFALEELQEIVRTKNFGSRKIAIDFFTRVFKRKTIGNLKKGRGPTRQGYELDFLTAIDLEKNKQNKQAIQKYKEILDTYGQMDPSICYESAKSIVKLSVLQKSRIDKGEMEDYRQTIKNFQNSIENKGYYQQKQEFIFNILDLIDPDNQEEDILIDYQLAKKCIIRSLQKAVKQAKDAKTRSTLNTTLLALQKDDHEAEELCYKFLGDKAYNQLLYKSHIRPNRPNKMPVEDNNLSPDMSRNQRMKATDSRWVNGEFDPEFEGSMMTKINFNSSGLQQRYFYIKQDFKKTWKLFYCSKKGKQTSEDECYRLKGMKKVTVGKKTDALQRKECEEFDETLCFTIHISGQEKYQRNFYVKEEEDYNNWVSLFKALLAGKSGQESRMKKTKRVQML